MQTGNWLYVLNIGVHLSSPNAIPHLGTDSKHKGKKEKTLRRIKIFKIRIFFFLHECFTKDRRTYKEA